MLGTFPVLIRPDTKSALIVGFGAGKAITGLPPTVKEVDVIELEPKVIAANQQYQRPRREYNPLQDPASCRFISTMPAVHLALTEKNYDTIISQPSHPWSAGASHLYTREYMQMVADHLNDNGVYLQWINSQFVDEALLKSLCATILDVYRYVRIYQWHPQVLYFVASDQPMDVEQRIVETGRPFRDAPLFYLEHGIATVEDAIAALMMDEEGVRQFAAGSRVITDDFNMMAMESAALIREGRELTVNKLAMTFRPWVPVLNGDSWVHHDLGEKLNFTRIADKFVLQELRGYFPGLIRALTDTGNPRALLLAGNLQDAEGRSEQAQELLATAFEAMPNSNQAKYALVEPWLRQLGGQQAPEEIETIANSMTGSARAVVEAYRAVVQKDLRTVADLDRQLAAAGPADPWFTEAVKLRIDWRSSVSNPELTTQFSEQAWRILDLAMANDSDHEFFTMRIFAASRAGRQNEVVQTARRYIYAVEVQLAGVEEGYISPGKAELDLKIKQVRAIAELLAAVDDADSTSTQDEIQESLDGLSQRLHALMLTAP